MNIDFCEVLKQCTGKEEKESFFQKLKATWREKVACAEFGDWVLDLPEEEKAEKIREATRRRDALIQDEREKEAALLRASTESDAERAYKVFLSTVPSRYKDADLKDFSVGSPMIQHILNGGSCLLTGTTGGGKTRLIYALGKYMSRRFMPYETEALTLPALVTKVRSGSGSSEWLEYAGEHYGKEVKMLFIDEYDKCKSSPSDYEIFNHIINERYNNRLQTVVVGNGDKDLACSILGDAVVSRLTGKADGGAYFYKVSADRRQK